MIYTFVITNLNDDKELLRSPAIHADALMDVAAQHNIMREDLGIAIEEVEEEG